MIELKPVIKQHIDVDIVMSNGKDINEVIEEICNECHAGLETSSFRRQTFEHDDYDKKDLINDYNELLEILEGKFCYILDLLED